MAQLINFTKDANISLLPIIHNTPTFALKRPMPSTPKDPLNGFQIAPILLNSSESTVIRYKLSTRLSKKTVDLINRIGGARMIHDRLIAIYEAGATLSFHKMHSEIFYTNIRAVDSDLIKLLPEIVLNSYLFGKSRLLDVLDVSNKKLHYIKFKRLLRTLALGMRPEIPYFVLRYIVISLASEILLP